MFKKFMFIAGTLLGLSACQSASLTGGEDLNILGSWHIEAAQGKAVIDYSPAQLVFAEDGALSGNNSCNQFFGQYQLDGQALTLSPAGSTMKACVDALMQQERNVMQAMSQVTQVKLVKGKLLLSDADGETQLVLSKQ
ncbi:META domain-containing protein [Shewanella rhizosphaerae]|uniref:META domain-containing protein n=1 Tax=Shewanella rhizosphaerae TaxID=2864207 RepID=UPI001C655407|nr:META domain-containing protein [Shewanella rhizosphaerae]QYK13657.1 META domain-containing protein [Shewanella rhizosphaerae]